MSQADLFDLHCGDSPLIVSVPHGGTEVPDALWDRMTEAARTLPDTDWHVPRLYGFARELGASVLSARLSRFVIDLNRPPTGESLYPGQTTTGLIPTELFGGEPIYRSGESPDAAETADRIERFWKPYHDALQGEIDRVRTRHGLAVLYDAHSIRSRLPRLFEGRLPDFNVGTAKGASCDSTLQASIERVFALQDRYTWIVNGRFVGGYITRRYGRPTDAVHAVQMEQSQITYMDEDWPFPYRDDRAAEAEGPLRAVLTAVLDWARARARAV